MNKILEFLESVVEFILMLPFLILFFILCVIFLPIIILIGIFALLFITFDELTN